MNTDAAYTKSTPLKTWLEFIENLHSQPIDLGLERMRTMVERLGIRFDCPVVTVAGTNGKGSTCSYIESMCLAHGFKTALHTSPHLFRFNERLRLNGVVVTDHVFLPAFEEVERARGDLTLTYFEYTGLAILKAMMDAQPDIVILEIGLGGRLDAMNVIDPTVSIVTAIGLDHMAYLGHTREAIALEKAHIYRAHRGAVCADPMPPQTLVDYAHEVGANLHCLGQEFRYEILRDQRFHFSSDLGVLNDLPAPSFSGLNQYQNASGALMAIQLLNQTLERPVTIEAMRKGLSSAYLPGRFEVCKDRRPCTLIFDVGHNPHAAQALAVNLKNTEHDNLITLGVFGMLADKDRHEVVRAVQNQIDAWFLGSTEGPRGLSSEELAQTLHDFEIAPSKFSTFKSVEDAMRAALQRAETIGNESQSHDVRILVFGSFVTVGQAYPIYEALPVQGSH